MTPIVLATLLVAQAAPERVLLIHTPSGAITERQSKLYRAHLKLELAKHADLRLAEGALPTGDQTECVREPNCLAQLASSTGADTVLFARTARLGSDSVVTMKRLRLGSGEIEQTTTRQVSGSNGEEMLAEIGPMVTEIFPQQALREGVREGVVRDDVRRWAPPPLKPWVFWTGAGATAISGALIAVFAVQKHNAESDFQDLLNGPVVDGTALVEASQRARSASHRTNATIGITAGLAVTTAIVAYFTDWNTARDKPLLEMQ